MTLFYGYPGKVWSVALASLGYLSQALGTASNPFTVLPLAENVMATLLNGIAAINANRISAIWEQQAGILGQIQSMPVVLPPLDATYYLNRLAAMNAAGPALAALVPTIQTTKVGFNLNNGQPAIPYPSVLEFYAGFNFETPPAGLNQTNLSFYASQCTTAFSDIANVIAGLQGGGLNYIYDLPNRFALEMSAYAELLGTFLGFTSSSPSALWNLMFVLPTLLMHADLLSGAPYTLAAQQDQLVRYLLINAVQQIQNFILTVARPTATPIVQATLLTGNSLMDVAARALGDFEQWSDIAQVNNLLPPFVGGVKAPNVATWGSQLLMPTSNGQSPVQGVVPNYLFNFLGVDLYFGPINGDFPAWSGDFQLISGYSNLRWALGRRMQTTLGQLIYHSDYGCRIPPEVGKVQTSATAGYITAFGTSCLLSDPRVQSVTNAITTVGPHFSLNFQGEVQPAGFGTNPVLLNEVIDVGITPTTPHG